MIPTVNTGKKAVKIKNGTAVWHFFKKTKRTPPYDPEIALLRIYVREMKIHAQSFITALFLEAKHWKQPKYCVCTFLNKLWYIYMMDCYSATKRHKQLTHAILCMDIKSIMLRKKILKCHIVYDFIYITFLK